MDATTLHPEEKATQPSIEQIGPDPRVCQPVDAYRKTMKAFYRPADFGVGISVDGKEKAVPVHVNGKRNPLPCVRRGQNGGQFGAEMRLTERHDVQHLRGEQAVFHVARDDRRDTLLALDIDGEPGTDWTAAAGYGLQLLAELGLNNDVFVEPGRSYPRKGGCYLWFQVRWAPRTTGPARRLYERALSRRLKEVAKAITAPEGIAFDDLKGTTSYREDNPLFDSVYAGEDSGTAKSTFEIGPDRWVPRYEPKKFLRSLGHDPDDIERAIGDLPRRWQDKTNLEWYDNHRLFYAVDAKTNGTPKVFNYDPRLERTRRHYGVLVTRPCYAALSGDRPNNVQDFAAWANSKQGVITHARLRKVIGPEECAKIEALLDPARRKMRRPSPNTEQRKQIAPSTQSPSLGSDLSRLLDEKADNHNQLLCPSPHGISPPEVCRPHRPGGGRRASDRLV